ncbi:P1 family peptidase [Blastochloris tepida]|uniref:Peptidase T4 n=1 Tax=Blastochloris tepida TaxID=2233851 RepID=A0A348FX57_9HYPH|nr:P1 family peptidase [Blastochloris tepida]BBF91890.1 peptidase T4 [Blastochloris tepida]
MRNLITDVPGLAVGQAEDPVVASGVTAILFDTPATASVDVRGGAPGTRETDLLSPEKTVGAIDAIVLSGGSAFGLDAAAGVQALLAERGRGFAIGDVRVPIVTAAVLFDLLNGGNKAWGRFPPYRELGYAAAAAAGPDFALGTAGAGYGATTADLKGGLGSASTIADSGHIVGALVAVNAVGSATIGLGGHFWAAAFEQDREFGGRGLPSTWPADAAKLKMKGADPGANTTIAVVATDAVLTKPEARQLAVMAQDGLARALHPVHTPLDGDTVFAAATGRRPMADPIYDLARLGAAAAITLARACARAVHAASALPLPGALPAWRDRFGG